MTLLDSAILEFLAFYRALMISPVSLLKINVFLFYRSGDSTARIWNVEGPSGSNVENGPFNVVLRHFKGRTNEKSKDVTTLDWNVSSF